MSAKWLNAVDKILRRVRCRCPICGFAITVSKRNVQRLHHCDLCGGAFVPDIYIRNGDTPQAPASLHLTEGRAAALEDQPADVCAPGDVSVSPQSMPEHT